MARPYRITIEIVVDREADSIDAATDEAEQARRESLTRIGGIVRNSRVVDVQLAERRSGGDRRKEGR